MILDALLQLADAQAVVASAYTTNTIDLGAVTPARRIGDGEPLALVFTVDVAAAGDDGSFTNTFDFIAVQSANANLGSHTEIAKRRIAAADLVAGAMIVVHLPPGTPTARYLGGRIEIGTGDTITVSCFVVPLSFIAKLQSYANGYTIL